jgi:hypothetical protein
VNCNSCNHNNKKNLKTFSDYPITHNFLKENTNKNKTVSMNFYQCKYCGLLQIKKTFSSKVLKPNLTFIKQREPEDHLDQLVSKILKLPKINKKMKIIGLTYKDQSIIDRFKKKGFKNANIIDLNKVTDFKSKIHFEFADIFFKPIFIKNYVRKFGGADLVISRHFMEHTFSLSNFLKSVKILLKKSDLGYFFSEVPDSLRSLKNYDYPMIWEQHKIYFTKLTLFKTLENYNFKKVIGKVAKYHYEDCLLYVGKVSAFKNKKKTKIKKNIENENRITKKYFKLFDSQKIKIKNYFRKLNKDKKIIALFGTGHQGVTFINIFNLEKYINFVYDDNKKIQNLCLPGTKMIIQNPPKKKGIVDYCFLCANFQNEKKIIKNNKNLLKKNGKFISISFHNSEGIKKSII